MKAFQFLEQTPIYSLDVLQVAPWPIQLQCEGMKSCSNLPTSGTLQASPTQVTERANEGTFFSNIERKLFNMYTAIKALLSKHATESLFKTALQSANPYAELFGTIMRNKELSTFRLLELGLGCQLFAHLDRAVRSLLKPAEVGQYGWNFVTISPHLYVDAIKTYIETRISDVPLGQVRNKLPISYTCIHSRRDVPRCTYSKIPFKAIQGPSLEDFTQIEKLKSLIVSNTHGQGAHLLLLEYDPTIPSTELYSNYIQYSQLPYFITSVLLAISPKAVKIGGSCIFKATDLWSPIHAEMLHLCEACYDYMAICKTTCTRVLNTERWIVLKSRNKNVYDINYQSFISAIDKLVNVVYPKVPSDPFTFCNSLIAPFLQKSTTPLDILNNTNYPTNLAQYIFCTNTSIMTLQTSLYIQALLLHGINRKNYTGIIQFVKEFAGVLKFSGVPPPASSSKSKVEPLIEDQSQEPVLTSIPEEINVKNDKAESSLDDSSEMMALSEDSNQGATPSNAFAEHHVMATNSAEGIDAAEEYPDATNVEALSICEKLNQSIGKSYTTLDIDMLEKYLNNYYSVRPRQVIPYQQYRDLMFGYLREALTLKPDMRSISYVIGKDTDNPGTNISWSVAETFYTSTAQLVEREQEQRKLELEAKMRKEKLTGMTKIGGLTTIDEVPKLNKEDGQEPEVKRGQRTGRVSKR